MTLSIEPLKRDGETGAGTPPSVFRPITPSRGRTACASNTSPWGGFAPGAWQYFDTTGYKDLTFAVYNESLGDNLWLVAQDSTGTATPRPIGLADYTETKSIPQGRWTWIRIPIADMLLGTNPILEDVAIQSGNAGAVVYFDQIEFRPNVSFYDGAQQAKGPSILTYNWSSTLSQIDSGGGDNYLHVTATGPWAGVQLQEQSTGRNVNGLGIPSGDFGGLSLVFRTSEVGQYLNVSLISETNVVLGTVRVDETYIPTMLGSITPGKWYRVLIPLSDFHFGSAKLGAVAIESGVAKNFDVDDVVLVEKLMFPNPAVHLVSGYYFGKFWDAYCSSYMKLHAGADYQASTSNPIFAAARGVVLKKNEQFADEAHTISWGWAVVIGHEDSFATSYLHLDNTLDAQGNPVISEGQMVAKGTFLGYPKYLSYSLGGTHLHFGTRIGTFEQHVSQAGALPAGACTIDGYLYPAFPGGFVDPERMDW